MKRYVLMMMFAACAVGVQAQMKGDAEVSKPLPALNPDLMTYFQEEMTAHMRYQMARDYTIPFFISARYLVTDLDRAGRVKDGHRAEDYFEYTSNVVTNAFIEWQGRINDRFYVPIFAAIAGGRIYGTPDAGSLIIDNLSSFDSGFIDESVDRYLFGSGLFVNGKTIKGGIYAGYCMEHYKTNNRGTIYGQFDWYNQYYERKDDFWKHSVKIALLPALDTSNWKYVGIALDSVLGYIGLGDAVEVYSGEEEKDKTAAAIARALNYGLDFAFSEFEFKPLSLDTRLFYRRDNYDAIARADAYGAALDVSSPLLPFGIESEFGFKHFYSVSKYFQSRYSDTWFFSIGISFSNFKSKFLFQRPFENIVLTYKYDAVVKHSFAISTAHPYLGAFVFELGFGENSYNNEKYYITENPFTIGLGWRIVFDTEGNW
jgi:hypothetical protein